MRQPVLPKEIDSKTLAVLLDISERAVHLRAKKGSWPRIYRRGRGGSSHLYLVAGLPDETRSAITGSLISRCAGRSERAAFSRGMTLTAESAAMREAGLAAYKQLPEVRQAEADARREILQARDAFLSAAGLPKKKGSLLFIREYRAGAIKLPESVEAALAGGRTRVPLSWASLHRWEKNYEEAGIAGLASGYGKTRKTGIPKHMQDFIKGLLTDRPHLGNKTVHDALSARFDGLEIPGESAVRRFVDKWKKENESLILYVTSFDLWRSRHMIAMGRADERVTRLNQVWEFDSTPGDVMLTDGRHSLIGVIDIYSRRAKIFVTPTSKAAAIAALIRLTIMDWGVGEVAKTDNGADYVSKHMVRVFEELGIEQVLCRPFHPEDKPYIERFFRTLLHSIFELLPGYIGHNVAERRQIRDRQSFAQRIMKQDQSPVGIRMTAEELQEVCDQWCNAVYHHNPHSSLNGKTPAQMAREWTEPVRRIRDERALDILLSPAPDGNGTREIKKKGIRVDNAWHIAPELGPYVGQTVHVLMDPIDYGTLYVFRMTEDGGKEFLCRAVNPDRTGHDRAEIAAIGKAVQERFMREGSKELKRLARQAGTEEIHREILAYRERQIDNLREFPRKSEDYTTPAIEEARLVVDDIERELMGPVPIAISPEAEKSAAELIDLGRAKREARPLPATPQEKYEQVMDDLRRGCDIADAELAWAKRYEVWLETGERAAY
jgi:putative transposase